MAASMASRIRSFVLVVFCLFYIAGWPGARLSQLSSPVANAAAPSHPDGDGVLDVVVRAADGDKNALEGARVRAFAMLDGSVQAAGNGVTDTLGHATLTDLAYAEYWIVAEMAHYARASQRLVVGSAARSRLDFVLGAEHVLDVVVRTDQGVPVEDVELEVSGADPFPVGGRTGPGGLVRVSQLGEGPFVVVARKAGFEEVTRRRAPEGQVCTITLGRQGALVVKVTSEAGESVQNARVWIASPALWPARIAETSADGIVRIGGLDPGSYALKATMGARTSTTELGITVGRGDETNVELKLVPGIFVAVLVTDGATDEPVGKARVTLAEAGLSPFPIEGLTNNAGRVVLGPMAHGPSALSVSADGFVAKSAVHVDDPPPPEVSLALARAGTLVGRVVDTRGYPVDGATIRVIGTDIDGMPIDEDPLRSSFREAHFEAALAPVRPLVPAGELGVMPGPLPDTPHGGSFGIVPTALSVSPGEPWITSRDGTFKAAPVTPGRVRVIVRHPQYVEAMSDVVTLASDREANLDIVLARGGALEGRVVDSRGRPVAGARVTAVATRGTFERVVQTETDGSFAFASVPEALVILVSKGDEASPTTARTEVFVPDGDRKSIEISMPEARDPLAVRVTGDRGSPVDAAQISAVSLDPGEALRTTAFTDAHGDAVLASAKGLALRIEVQAPGYASKVMVTSPDISNLDVSLEAGESMVGEVWANRRETIEGAEVILQTEIHVYHARTGRDGEFVLGDLAAGPAHLRIRAKGRAPVDRDVVVEDYGGRHPTDIGKLMLPEDAIIEGTVVDGKGEPVPGARVAKDSVPTYLQSAVVPPGVAVCDARGRFRLGEMSEGTVVLEAYAPDVGRGRTTGVRAFSGHTTDGVKIVLAADGAVPGEPPATGGVAVTLGETSADPSETDVTQIVVVSVSEGSEASRSGLAPNDVLVEVGGVTPTSIVDARARLSGPLHDDVLVKVRRGERMMTLRIRREAVTK
jgi:hypothetical protein